MEEEIFGPILPIIPYSTLDEAIDIIHTNSTRSDVGFFLSKIFHKPHIIHIREFGDNDYGCKPLNPFWKLYYNKFSHKFLCVSKAVMNHWIAKGIDPSKCKLLYDGIAYENIPESSDESKFDERLRVVMSGSVLPTKGQYLAIKAIGSLPKEIKEHLDDKCIFCGKEAKHMVIWGKSY